MAATDLKRQIRSYTARRGRFDVLTVPPMQFLAVDGHGDPDCAPAYRDALATIYPVAYRLKLLSRHHLGHDYTVMPLEALWSADDLRSFTEARDKSRWDWTLLNLVPHWMTTEHLDAAREAVGQKGGAPALDRLTLRELDEGLAVQTLHVGPYDDEGPVLAEMHQRFVPSHGLRLTGRHHEVYLNDPRRTAPQRLRTILRQPVARVG